ncbi:MAG: AI-2E family transporter [Bacteroidales bacterium]|nr:AI-2E family transporter [Bacteroidales bacterium]MBQ6184640.1 AI-2E family transporter [Bacteroidales bacterium]MBQ8061782.1 AI-2E family transporter [Bacteroidales bacterium]
MAEERSSDKLARYIMWAAAAAIIIAFCWYFRSVLVYIILAAVVSLLARPVMKLLRKIKVKGKSAPDWLLAILSLILILGIFLGIVTQVIPVVSSIIQSVSGNLQTASFNASEIARWMDKLNIWLIDRFPTLGRDFKLQEALVTWLKNAFDMSSITSVVGSVASALGSFGVGLFSVVFIGFFFIKDDKLFRRIVGSLVPDKVEDEAIQAIGDIEHLLSRYFGGLLIEVLGVATLNFLGLWLIAKIGFYPAIGIAFMAGLLNVIPYVGPWIGAAIGVVLGLVLKFSSAAALGVFPNFWVILITLVAIFAVTQMVDNFFFQPFIYSTSIKSTPLEIFIVLLMAGHVGGILGMLVAIPTYTVIRVVAARFLKGFKPVKRLIEATSDED